MTSILRHIIIAGEDSSKLTMLLSFPSLSLSPMLIVTNGVGFGT